MRSAERGVRSNLQIKAGCHGIRRGSGGPKIESDPQRRGGRRAGFHLAEVARIGPARRQ